MIALWRYQLATVFATQRYLPPVLLFLAVLAVFTSNDAGPVLPIYAVSAGAVFVCGTWLAVTVLNAEDPVQRTISAVNASGAGRVLVAGVAVALAGEVLLTAIGLGFPLLVGQHTASGAELALGALAELTGACSAVAVGLLCSRLVFRRPGYALLVALGAALGLLLIPGLPPINPVFRLLARGGSAEGALGPVVLFSVVSGLLLVLSTVVIRLVSQRRD